MDAMTTSRCGGVVCWTWWLGTSQASSAVSHGEMVTRSTRPALGDKMLRVRGLVSEANAFPILTPSHYGKTEGTRWPRLPVFHACFSVVRVRDLALVTTQYTVCRGNR